MLALRSVLLACVLSCSLSVAAKAVAESKQPPVQANAKPDLGEPEAVAEARARLLLSVESEGLATADGALDA